MLVVYSLFRVVIVWQFITFRVTFKNCIFIYKNESVYGLVVVWSCVTATELFWGMKKQDSVGSWPKCLKSNPGILINLE